MSNNKQPLVKDEDVIKALECCSLSNTHQEEDCDNCPFKELPLTICQNLLAYHALQIIKRYKMITIKNLNTVSRSATIGNKLPEEEYDG